MYIHVPIVSTVKVNCIISMLGDGNGSTHPHSPLDMYGRCQCVRELCRENMNVCIRAIYCSLLAQSGGNRCLLVVNLHVMSPLWVNTNSYTYECIIQSVYTEAKGLGLRLKCME